MCFRGGKNNIVTILYRKICFFCVILCRINKYLGK